MPFKSSQQKQFSCVPLSVLYWFVQVQSASADAGRQHVMGRTSRIEGKIDLSSRGFFSGKERKTRKDERRSCGGIKKQKLGEFQLIESAESPKFRFECCYQSESNNDYSEASPRHSRWKFPFQTSAWGSSSNLARTHSLPSRWCSSYQRPADDDRRSFVLMILYTSFQHPFPITH